MMMMKMLMMMMMMMMMITHRATERPALVATGENFFAAVKSLLLLLSLDMTTSTVRPDYDHDNDDFEDYDDYDDNINMMVMMLISPWLQCRG